MKKILSVLPILLLLAACGERVEVPPAHVGKVLTKNGYLPETISPSKFRLPKCFWYCDSLVLVETSDEGGEEAFRLFMPKDQLNMNFDLRFTISVDPTKADDILARLPAKYVGEDREYQKVTVSDVYNVYGKPIVRSVTRAVMAEYKINDVASSREQVSGKIYEALNAAFAATPLRLKRADLADIQFPEVITKAKESAKEREIAIEQAEAQKQVKLVELQTELETAKAQRAIRRERAEAALEENKIFAQSVTDEYLKYKTLEVMEALAENGNAVFVPMSALDNLGLQQRLFQAPK